MLRFKNYLSEEVLPSAQVKDGSIDLDKPAVRGQINASLASVTAQPAVTPYIVLHKISKTLAYFHIIMPKRAYLEGDKGIEVVELKQFGHRMGMTNDGQFVHDVPGRYYLFLSYRLAPSVGGYGFAGDQLQSLGGSFKVTAKVVDEVELQSLLASAEVSLAEDCDAYENQQKYKAMAPKEGMHTALGDCDCSQGDSPSTKSAVDTSMRRKDKKLSAAELDEAMSRKQKNMAVRRFMSHNPKAGESILDMGERERKEKKSFDSAKKEIKRLKEEEQIDEEPITGSRRLVGSNRRKRKAVQMALGRKHKGEEGWNDRTRLHHSALTMGRKLQKQGVTKEETLDEGGMPASVIKHKQKLASMSSDELKKKFAGKTKEELQSMARRHGYGKDSDVYSKHIKEEEHIDEASVGKLLNYKREREGDVRATKISASHSRDMSKDPSLSRSKRKEFSDEEKWLTGKRKKMEAGIKLADAKLKGKAKVNAPLPKHPYMEETLDETHADNIRRKYRQKEDDNDHTGNVHLMTRVFGSKKERETSKKMLRKRDKQGYMSGSDSKKGYEMTKDYARRMEKLKEETDAGDETNMARTQLKAVCDKSKNLVSKMKSAKNLPAWVQSKIAVAKDGITAVDDYISHSDEKKLDEKLTKAMSAGDVISDFIHSKDPKFKGKSKKERQKMALGAYYDMHPEKSKLDEMMSRIKKTTAHRKMATSVDTQTRHALGAKKEDTKTILVTKKGDPRAAAGGGVRRIPKDKFDPSIYNRASE